MKTTARWMTCLALLSGCHREEAAPAPARRRPVARRPTPSRASSRKVEAGSGEVTIAHEAMPGFMDAMTMPFVVADRSALDDVRPGDEVEGPLVVDFEGGKVRDYRLTGLVVTRPSTGGAGGDAPALERPPTLKVGELVPDFAVTTQDGATLRLSDLRGDVVALTFIYTRCPLPDFCPALDTKFAEIARRVSAVPGRADRVRLLSISFDPEHDTPEALRAHARLRGARPPLWRFAVASHEELARVAPSLGLEYAAASGQVVHNRVAAVIGPDGRLARLESGGTWTPDELVRSIYSRIVTPGK